MCDLRLRLKENASMHEQAHVRGHETNLTRMSGGVCEVFGVCGVVVYCAIRKNCVKLFMSGLRRREGGRLSRFELI